MDSYFRCANNYCTSIGSGVISYQSTCSEGEIIGLTTNTLPWSGTVTQVAKTYTNTVNKAYFGADILEIRWQSSDLASITSNPATPLPSASSDTSQSTPTSTSSAVPSSGLTTGSKIAIGVVVPIAVLAVLGTFIFLWRRKRKSRRVVQGGNASQGAEYTTHQKEQYTDAGPAISQEPVELQDRRDPQELSSKTVASNERYELGGNEWDR